MYRQKTQLRSLNLAWLKKATVLECTEMIFPLIPVALFWVSSLYVVVGDVRVDFMDPGIISPVKPTTVFETMLNSRSQRR